VLCVSRGMGCTTIEKKTGKQTFRKENFGPSPISHLFLCCTRPRAMPRVPARKPETAEAETAEAEAETEESEAEV
jgi:hypothetical protein